MTKITLSPTTPLTEYAKAHLEELKFGPQDTLLPGNPEIFERRDLNFFGRFVKKIDESQSLIVAITRLVVTILLALSLVGIPLLVLAYREFNQQKKEEELELAVISKLNLCNEKINKRAAVIEKLQLNNFQNIPH